MLGRVNRELGANFDLKAFQHGARYNEPERRIEMHLHALAEQNVTIAAADFSSYPHRRNHLDGILTQVHSPGTAALSGAHRLYALTHWVDQEWPFVEALWTVRR